MPRRRERGERDGSNRDWTSQAAREAPGDVDTAPKQRQDDPMELLKDTLATLSASAWLTLIVVGAATVTMARERFAPDIVMFGALCVLVVAGVIAPGEALVGFAHPAVFTIGVLLVVAGAVQETGALRMVSGRLFGKSTRPVPVLLRLMLPTAGLSAFLNNTPIVAMLIPIVRSHARAIGIPPSKLLLPLAWAAMFGGTCTMVGTSANLVVQGMLARKGAPLGIFDIALVGIPTTLVGIAYLVTVGYRRIPDRTEALTTARDEARDYLVELVVPGDSPLVGVTVEDAGLRSLPGLFLARIRRRDGTLMTAVAPSYRLHEGDLLILTGIATTVQDLLSQVPGLAPVDEPVQVEDPELYEVVISYRSPLVGLTVRDAQFRRRYNAAIIAVHREGARIDQKIGDIVLEPGDTLMVWAPSDFRTNQRSSTAFYVIGALGETGTPARFAKARLVVATMAVMVLVPAFTEVPLLVSGMGALVVLFVTGCLGVRTARSSVNGPVLVMIGSAIGLAAALEQTGAAQALATGLLTVTRPLGPWGTLAAVYLLGVTLAAFVSNAAGAALVLPVALEAAALGGHDPTPFAIAIAMAASAGFSTPIGCPPNLLVYGPGGYRYLDFARVGLPLNALFLVVAVTLIPLWWPFS